MEEVFDSAEQVDESALVRVEVFYRLKIPYVKMGCTMEIKDSGPRGEYRYR